MLSLQHQQQQLNRGAVGSDRARKLTSKLRVASLAFLSLFFWFKLSCHGHIDKSSKTVKKLNQKGLKMKKVIA
jgi:hypothetical protein